MSGHSKWSSIKHKKGAADAKRGQLFSKLTRAIIVAARDGGPDPDANATLATADPEGARQLDAEGEHRACDRTGLRIGHGRRVVLDRHLRGLRRRRRRRLRRGADRQPKPYGGRGEAHVRQARRQPGHERGGRLALRAARRRHRPGHGGRGRAHARGRGRRCRRRRARRLELPGDRRAGRPADRACRARRGGHRLSSRRS